MLSSSASSGKRVFRNVLIGLVLSTVALGAAGCSFSPVYSTGAQNQALVLQFNEPANRLVQVITQDLSRHFRAGDDDAPLVMISARSSSRALTRTKAPGSVVTREMRVTATLRIVDEGKTLFSTSRFAVASYTSSDQVLANQAASSAAAEQAARAVAESLRLSVLAGYSPP